MCLYREHTKWHQGEGTGQLAVLITGPYCHRTFPRPGVQTCLQSIYPAVCAVCGVQHFKGFNRCHINTQVCLSPSPRDQPLIFCLWRRACVDNAVFNTMSMSTVRNQACHRWVHRAIWRSMGWPWTGSPVTGARTAGAPPYSSPVPPSNQRMLPCTVHSRSYGAFRLPSWTRACRLTRALLYQCAMGMCSACLVGE